MPRQAYDEYMDDVTGRNMTIIRAHIDVFSNFRERLETCFLSSFSFKTAFLIDFQRYLSRKGGISDVKIYTFENVIQDEIILRDE